MLRGVIIVASWVLLTALDSANAIADHRVALVIGNAQYKFAPALTNPRNDASDVATALKSLGVDVVEGFDLDKTGMERLVRSFAERLSRADVGIFYYAGHGLQVNGTNYLIPVDAELASTAALEFEVVRVDVVQRIMEAATKSNIIFLDACRNNPLSRNLARALGTRLASVREGLAAVEAGAGTLISFSTAPGSTASDGTGRNSPYSGALVNHLVRSTDDVSSMLIGVRKDVMASTRDQQVPWEHSALTSKIYFSPVIGRPGVQPEPAPTLAPAVVPSPRPPSTISAERIRQYIEWEFLEDREQFDDFVDYYDKGVVSRTFVAGDKLEYARKWPARKYNLRSETVAVHAASPNQYDVTFSFGYKISNGAKVLTGDGRTRVTLRLEGTRFIVTNVKEVLDGN